MISPSRFALGLLLALLLALCGPLAYATDRDEAQTDPTTVESQLSVKQDVSEDVQAELPPGLEIELEGQMIFDREGVSRFTGPVTVTWRGSRIQADSIVFRDKRYLEGEGNILIVWEGNWIAGRSFTYDLEEERGVIQEARGISQGEFLFWAKSAEKIGDRTVRLHKATVTSCTQPVPYWSFGVSSATITLDKYARMWNARLKAARLPVFYLPYMVWPVRKDRAAGLLFPEFSSTRTRGEAFSQELFIPLGRSADLTLLGRYYTEAGMGIGGELRFLPNEKGAAMLNGFFIDDKVDGKRRYSTSYRQTQQFANGFRMLGNINMISDFDFYSDFARDLELVSSPTILTRLEFSRNGSWTSINIREQRREQLFVNGDRLIQESIPEIEWRGRSRRVGKTPLYLTYESSLAWIRQRTKQEDGLVQDRSNYYRGDLYPTLSLQLSKLPWVDITPRVGYRVTHYTQHNALPAGAVDGTSREIVDESLTRTLWGGGVVITGPKIVKIFERPNSQYSPRYKHLIEPRITYGYQETYDRSDDLIVFDEVDRFSGAGNQISYSLTQRFFAQRPRATPKRAETGGFSVLLPDGSADRDGAEDSLYDTVQEAPPPELDKSVREPVEIATLEFTQSRSLDRELTFADLDEDGIRETSSPSSNVGILGRFNPNPSTSLDLRSTYDILYKDFRSVDLSGSYRNSFARIRFSLVHNNGLGVQLTSVFDEATQEYVEQLVPVEDSTQLRFASGLKLIGGKLRLDLESTVNFDPSPGQSTLADKRWRALYSTQCCTFMVEQLVRSFGSSTDRDDWYFRIDFKGIGRILKIGR